MKFLTVHQIIQIHEKVIESHELQGFAGNKSIESVISRINNRITFGLIEDVFALAACYASFISVGHVFNDANKRTAFMAMDICLLLNGIKLTYETEIVGQLIVKLSQGEIDEMDLAKWLRNQI
jgi:death-on-curing protein